MPGSQTDIVGKIEQGIDRLKDTINDLTGNLIGGPNGINARLVRMEEGLKNSATAREMSDLAGEINNIIENQAGKLESQDKRIAYLEKVVWVMGSTIVLGFIAALIGRSLKL